MKKHLLTVLLLSLITAGALFTWQTVSLADRELRDDLLLKTRMVACALDLREVGALSGTKADLSSPDYLRLKEQLAAVRAVFRQSGR